MLCKDEGGSKVTEGNIILTIAKQVTRFFSKSLESYRISGRESHNLEDENNISLISKHPRTNEILANCLVTMYFGRHLGLDLRKYSFCL